MSRSGPARARPRDPDSLETAIGHRFADRELLELALTHRSRSGARNNERLEFLGHAWLGFVVADELYRRHPRARENELTLIRASLVREATLAELARGLELDEYLLFGRSILGSGAFRRDSILSDAMEALIGAVLLDGGEAPARTLILDLLGSRLEAARPGVVDKDPKTRLQEFLQARGETLPEYSIDETRGSGHALEFVVTCTLTTRGIDARAVAGSRRVAEQKAATKLLSRLEEEPRG